MSTKSSERRNLGRRLSGVTMPINRKRMKWGRNWPCLCGSEKKYKRCCFDDTNKLTLYDGNANVEVLSEDIQRMIDVHNKKQKTGDMEKNG